MTDQTSSKEAVVIHAVGGVGPRPVEYGMPVEKLFSRVHQKIKEADISFCHLESVLSTRGCLQYRDYNTWASRVHPDNARSLAFAGFNVVSQAGNRCFDYGPEALLDSIEAVRSRGMLVTGAGKDLADARRPAILERKGIKVGFLDYCSVLPVEYEAREGKPGCSPIRVSTYWESQGYQPGIPPRIITVAREEDVRDMEGDIRKLRSQVDVLVVSTHWGQDYIPSLLCTYQPLLARRAIDAGADIILGHHGHNIRGLEMYRGRPVFYCLGTFAQERSHELKPPPGVQDISVPKEYHNWVAEPGWERNPGPRDRRYTMMAKIVAGKKGVQRVSFLPGWTDQMAHPEFLPAGDPRFKEVVQCLDPWNKRFGVTFSIEGDEAVVSN
ncbi:MAG: CapA family protein [Chloroflexi bacterium]|nr:CapA family protein [Chloroflexota bacterium]